METNSIYESPEMAIATELLKAMIISEGTDNLKAKRDMATTSAIELVKEVQRQRFEKRREAAQNRLDAQYKGIAKRIAEDPYKFLVIDETGDMTAKPCSVCGDTHSRRYFAPAAGYDPRFNIGLYMGVSANPTEEVYICDDCVTYYLTELLNKAYLGVKRDREGWSSEEGLSND